MVEQVPVISKVKGLSPAAAGIRRENESGNSTVVVQLPVISTVEGLSPASVSIWEKNLEHW